MYGVGWGVGAPGGGGGGGRGGGPGGFHGGGGMMSPGGFHGVPGGHVPGFGGGGRGGFHGPPGWHHPHHGGGGWRRWGRGWGWGWGWPGYYAAPACYWDGLRYWCWDAWSRAWIAMSGAIGDPNTFNMPYPFAGSAVAPAYSGQTTFSRGAPPPGWHV